MISQARAGSVSRLSRREDAPPVSMETCLRKAINVQETAVKEKHVRSAIIGTYQERGATTFWDCALRLPLKENAIVMWKFCHVLHKVLREGHDLVLRDSQRFRPMLQDHGRFWSHLKTGYGTLIKIYSSLLHTKLSFHLRNNRIPGNLEMNDEQLIQCAGDSDDAFFQLSVEMFDYLDCILELQNEIFKTMDSSRCNSMTNAGQCRLKPLIPCIQDSMLLYDYTTKILFRLHAKLSHDLLNGHRERFLKVFHGLQKFYAQTMSLQYFKNLISIQQLPKTPPNFSVLSDLENYETKKVTVYDRDVPDGQSDTASDLVDLQDLNGSGSPDPSVMALAMEKERMMDELRGEIERLKSELVRLQMEARNQIRQLQFEKQELTAELQLKISQLATLEQKVNELEAHECQESSEQSERLDRAEKHIKVVEDKFGKMKEVYANLRVEHIDLLRKKGAIDKELSELKRAAESQSEMAIVLEQVKQDREQIEQDLSKKLSIKKEECENLENSLQQLQSQVTAAESDKIAVESTLMEQITLKEAECSQLNASLTQLKSQIQNVQSTKEELEEGLKKELEFKANQLKALEEAKDDLEKSNQTLTVQMNDLNGRLETIAKELNQTNVTNESFREQIAQLQVRISDNQKNMETEAFQQYNELLDVSIDQSEAVIRKALEELENPLLTGGTGSLDHFVLFSRSVLQNEIPQLESRSSADSFADFKMIKGIVEQLPGFTNSCSTLMIYGGATSKTSADIQKGDDLLTDCKNFGQSILGLFEALRKRKSKKERESGFATVREKLAKLLDIASTMGSSLTAEADAAEVLDKELHAMELAIEEASKKMEEILSKSRASHTGVKLEVNEKLIDSCTALMTSIRLLVQRARGLQIEIAAQGKGSGAVKEFYKRNHQWTEGLISAAKSVGIGAKFLMESADKAVTNSGGNFEFLIASSQEIAASTIQLVVASQVRADRSSSNLSLLKQASTGVKTATAHVVATAKDCAQLIEESEEMDVTKLNPHQTKRLELETQAEVLRLESELEKSRMKLSALRQHHYHNSDG